MEYYYPDKPGVTWKELPGVWGEGTPGAAVAYLKTGNTGKAKEILDEVLKLQTPDGGVIYFTREMPHEFFTYPSVASTAWLVMALSVLEDEELLSDFWGNEQAADDFIHRPSAGRGVSFLHDCRIP